MSYLYNLFISSSKPTPVAIENKLPYLLTPFSGMQSEPPILDSKLFYGCELGDALDVMPLLTCVFGSFETEEGPEPSVIDLTEWLNTQLPEGLFLEVSYPQLPCDDKDMFLHLNMLEYDEPISSAEMADTLSNAKYDHYSYLLGRLNLEYKPPTFYTLSYKYK